MLTNLRLKNFKAFESISVDLPPIVILLGPNNSGKSSLIAALRILVQTAESHDTAVPLLLNGLLGDFGTYKDVVYGNHRGRPFEIELSFTPPKRLARHTGAGPITCNLEYKHRTKRRETILRTASFDISGQPIIRLEYSFSSERHLVASLLGQEVQPALKAPLAEQLNVRHFAPYMYTPYELDADTKLGEFLASFNRDRLRLPTWVGRSIIEALYRIDYLGPMREPPQRTYLFTGERRRRIGPSGEHAAPSFMLDEMRGGEDEASMSQKTNDWLRAADIGQEVEIEMLSDRHYELRVTHSVTGESENISDVGYGNSQVLPVILGGYRLQQGGTYLVEQPEIHLHPRAASELGTYFVNLYEAGKQSMVETHSEYLVLRLQRHVAEGDVPPDDVGVYYIHPEEEAGKIAKRMQLDDRGRFVNEWPEGFFPERLSEAEDIARARQ